MDKFMPKTIEELNAEFEARMEKAKQDELNAAAERAAEEILLRFACQHGDQQSS